MQRVHIDFSLFTPSGAVGVLDGAIECAAIPRAGEIVSFMSPKPGVTPPSVPGFAPMLKVEHVVHHANASAPVALSMASVALVHDEHVSAITQFFEQGFGLGFTPHPNWEGSA